MSTWREHDLRLVPVALLAWLVVALGEVSARPALLGVLVALAAIVAAGLAVRVRHRRPRWLPLVLASCIAAGVIGVLALSRLEARQDSVVSVAADHDGYLRFSGVVESRPRTVRGSPDRVVVQVAVERAEYRGHRSACDVAVMVLGDRSEWAGVLPGTPVRAAGAALRPTGASSVVALIVGAGAPRIEGSAPRWSVLAERVRAGLREAAAVNDPDPAGLLVALVDGDTSGISAPVQEDFRRSGLAHLLAVSGANVAVIVGALLWGLRAVRMPFSAQIGSAAVGLTVFVVVAGPEPSVLRAAAMGTVMLIGLASGRPRSAVPALSAAVLGLVVLLPSLAVSVGFVLSVLATAAIVTVGAGWTARLAGSLPLPLAAALAVAGAAALATLPVVVLLLPTVNVASVIANVLAAPAVPLATVCGVAAAVCAPFAALPAELLCFAGGFCTRWIGVVARLGSEPGPWQIPLPAGLLALCVVLGGLVAAALLIRATRQHPVARQVLAGLLVGALVLAAPVRCVMVPGPSDDWLVAACDVGQGDAVLARAGPHAAVVIDTGPDPAAVDDCLRRLRVDDVPLVLLTHFHDDHVAGIPAVLSHHDVGRVVFGGFDGAGVETSIRTLAARHGVPVEEVAPGWRIRAGAVDVLVLGPVRRILGSSSDPNNNSVVARATVGGLTMLAAGDAQVEQEQTLLGCGCLRADVLKVPHHGSKNRAEGFFARTGARIALISVGADNDYGHPAADTVTELESLGMVVRRTDRDGTVLVTRTDGGLAVSGVGGA
ncbi:ComEC/Rec2 family competence protein [Cumulibacter manganitolerans]|uniref:ComEC/Rec2 family competence protein n=1 Tax=Cumulibacter manganitolerans TaxID=1884992 RepID=UPI001294B1BA|nr:ComEC/Rec2 family competence protein [Cumulibacter manganitolerans]